MRVIRMWATNSDDGIPNGLNMILLDDQVTISVDTCPSQVGIFDFYDEVCCLFFFLTEL